MPEPLDGWWCWHQDGETWAGSEERNETDGHTSLIFNAVKDPIVDK